MAGDALAVHVDREIRRDQRGQLLLDVRAHAEVLRPRLLRRIDVEPRALAEVVGLVVGHVVAARAGVGRDEDDRRARRRPRRYSPLSITLAWVQVRPERYHSTGSFAPAACSGTKTAKVISVPVLGEAWR